MGNVISVPVLLIVFNRPDTTKIVFNRILEAKPSKLYIAVDGPRKNNDGEAALCNQVRQIVENVNWPCETHYKYNDENKGAEVTVSSAITWVFESEEYAIILEDDIVAPLSFFNFTQEMLLKYKDENRIATVTGSNFTPIPVPNDTDYFFAKYGHSGGGWATWKRTWNGFDLDIAIPENHLKLNFLQKITNSKIEARYYQRAFKKMKKEGVGNSTWDLVGLYRHRINNSLSIIPKVNLTSNIGIFGLHAKGASEHHFRSFDENYKVKKHPCEVECFTEYDIYHFKTYILWKRPLIKRLIGKFRKIVKISMVLL